jgi:hypothetical protein
MCRGRRLRRWPCPRVFPPGACSGRHEIIGLVPCALRRCEAETLHEAGQHLQLLYQLIVKGSAGLVGFERFVPIGWFVECVPADQHGARLFGLVKTQQKVGESQDRTGTLVSAAPNGLG